MKNLVQSNRQINRQLNECNGDEGEPVAVVVRVRMGFWGPVCGAGVPAHRIEGAPYAKQCGFVEAFSFDGLCAPAVSRLFCGLQALHIAEYVAPSISIEVAGVEWLAYQYNILNIVLFTYRIYQYSMNDNQVHAKTLNTGSKYYTTLSSVQNPL